MENQLQQVGEDRSTNLLLLEQVNDQFQTIKQKMSALKEKQQTTYQTLREILQPLMENMLGQTVLKEGAGKEPADPLLVEGLTEKEISTTYFKCQQINQQLKEQFALDRQKLTEVQTNSQHLTEELTALEASLKTASDALRLEEGKLSSLKEQTEGVSLEQLNEEQEQLAAQSSRLAALIEADQLEEQRFEGTVYDPDRAATKSATVSSRQATSCSASPRTLGRSLACGMYRTTDAQSAQ